MSDQCLIAEFSDRSSFETALDVLDKAHYTDEHVSVVTRADEVEHTLAGAATDTPPESPPGGKTTAATTLAGGTLGAFLGTATMMGPMLVAGPILGMAAGAFGGILLSNVESFGVKRNVGRQYETKVAHGSCLVIVTGDDFEINDAARVLKTCGPVSLERFQA